ncbi:MAG: DUF2851 family protein [Candidatus Kapaibacterium sp.]
MDNIFIKSQKLNYYFVHYHENYIFALMEIIYGNINELNLQKDIHLYISEPARIYKTESGRRLQIISPGRLNRQAGPDLLDIAILLDGYLIIGDAEFHKKSSDWNKHLHDNDINYKNVVLHIVLVNDAELKPNFETLVLDYNNLLQNDNLETDVTNTFSPEELQNLALRRLLRRTAEAGTKLRCNNLKSTFSDLISSYLNKYGSRKNRHKYSTERLAELSELIISSYAYDFLARIQAGESVNIQDSMIRMVKYGFGGEGAHLRRELILNSILPLALALADDDSRINLFVWYWSTPALNVYGLLTRRFPEIPQNFIWQQQGMLEYIKMYGSRQNVASETLNEYGFAEILSFYRLGRLPLEIYNSL